MTERERKRLLKILQRAVEERTYLLRISDVLGYAVGFRRKDGQWVAEPVLVVYVKKGRKKRKPSDFPRHQRIPYRIRLKVRGKTVWLGVDLVESEVGQLCNTATRPDLGIGNLRLDNNTGTIGWIARRQANDEVVVCSDFHVLLRFNGEDGGSDLERNGERLVYRHPPARAELATNPSREDGGDINKDRIGTVLAGLRSQLVDIAISSVQSTEKLNEILNLVGPIGKVRLLSVEELNPNSPIRVILNGRTSGSMSGFILEYPANLLFKYPDRNVLLVDLITTDIQTKGGDSGALLLDENQHPMGMLVGRVKEQERSYFMHIKHIIKTMGLKEFVDEV